MKVACAAVRLVKVCATGRIPAGIVTLAFRPAPTLEVKKPDSCRRRCSKAAKKKVRSFLIGPPKVAPYCARVNGGSETGAKALRAWKLRWRKKPKTLPRKSFVPPFVT